MRIAIPVTDGLIANHPGHCETFFVFEVNNGEVSGQVELPNPGHGPGGPPPVFLAREQVSELLAWGLPAHARMKFAALGIKVHLGATGEPAQALRQHLAGTLVPTTDGLDGGGGGGGGCGHGHEHGH